MKEFRSKDTWTIFRIMAEFVEGFETLGPIWPAVSVFGGARAPVDSETYRMGREIGRSLGREGFAVITGGGPGAMEAANRGAHEVEAPSIGLNIKLPFEQGPNPFVSERLHFEFHYFFMRKFWFAYLAKALVVFPGGFGTLDEVFELLTLVQTQKLSKELKVILYGTDYWDQILDFKPLVEWGAIHEDDLKLMDRVDTPKRAFQVLRAHLETHHLRPEVPDAETRTPDIAKTRG